MPRDMIHSKIWHLIRGTAAFIAVSGFLAALAVTVTVGSMFRDDDDSKKNRSNLPSSLR